MSAALRLRAQALELLAIAAELEASEPAPPATPPAETWISTKQAMRLTGVDSPSSIYRWADEGLIASRRDGGRRQFREADLLAVAELRAGGRLRRIAPANGEEA